MAPACQRGEECVRGRMLGNSVETPKHGDWMVREWERWGKGEGTYGTVTQRLTLVLAWMMGTSKARDARVVRESNMTGWAKEAVVFDGAML